MNGPALVLVSVFKVLGNGSDPQSRTQGLALPCGPPATWAARREATGTVLWGLTAGASNGQPARGPAAGAKRRHARGAHSPLVHPRAVCRRY